MPRMPEKIGGTIEAVIAMTGMKRLIGMPVILDGQQIGNVVRGVVRRDGKALAGLIVRDGLRASRYLDVSGVRMLGKLSVICDKKPERVPREAAFRLFRVTDANGARVGLVTDVLLDESTMRVTALEISSGPVDDLIAGRWYTTSFDVRAMGGTGHVTVPCRQN